MGRGGQLVWLPYLGVTIVAPYLLPGKTPYSRSVRNSLIILLDCLGWRWDIRSTNTQLVVEARTQILRLAGSNQHARIHMNYKLDCICSYVQCTHKICLHHYPYAHTQIHRVRASPRTFLFSHSNLKNKPTFLY